LWTDVGQDFSARLAGYVDSILRWVTSHSLKILGFQRDYRSAVLKNETSMKSVHHCAPLHKT